MKIAVALAEGIPDVRDNVAEAVRQVNQKAAEEERGGVVEVVGWCQEASYPGFYRESVRLLIEKIASDFAPDVILGVFWGRLGVARQDAAVSPEEEFQLLASNLARDDHPRVRLYFLDKAFNPRPPDERDQKEFYLNFRGYFSSESNLLFPYVKQGRLTASIHDYLWGLISQSTRARKQPLELS